MSKGSRPRPYSVSQEQFGNNYDAIFGKKEKNMNKAIGDGYTREELLEAVPNARTVPQIFLDGELVGGFTELKARLNG